MTPGSPRDAEPPQEEGQPAGTTAPETAPEMAPAPSAILEALLFVGNEDNSPLSARKAASLIGGVSPDEVQEYVDQLNEAYEAEGAPYQIEAEGDAFRMVLREEFQRVRDRFYARVKEARLSPAAVEVLAIVAYRQPIRGDEVDELRGAKSGAVLAQLVRRQLLVLERPADSPRRPLYRTTDRFLRVYGLASLEDLPQVDLFKAHGGPSEAAADS